MTVIIGLETPDGAWIGVDSYIGNSSWKDRTDRPKFFERSGLCIGTAGGFRAGALIEAIPKFLRQRGQEDSLVYLNRAVVEPIRHVHVEHGIVTDGEADFSAIILFQGRVYTLLSDYGLVRSQFGYMAVGDGEPYALGSLASTDSQDPQTRIELALKAAAKHCSSVLRPFHMKFIPARKPRQKKTNK